jgi:hypothetical protein
MPPPPRYARWRISKIVLAARLRARALPTTTPRKRFASGKKEGGEAPKGACQPLSAQHQQTLPMPGRGSAPRRQVYAVCALICLRGALAFRRFAAALARTFTSWLSSRPCLLRLGPGRHFTHPFRSQCSDSTSRLGRSTEENDAQSRSGADCKSDCFANNFKAHSEKLSLLALRDINGLASSSEQRCAVAAIISDGHSFLAARHLPSSESEKRIHDSLEGRTGPLVGGGSRASTFARYSEKLTLAYEPAPLRKLPLRRGARLSATSGAAGTTRLFIPVGNNRPRSGRGGRRFKSCHSDQFSQNDDVCTNRLIRA